MTGLKKFLSVGFLSIIFAVVLFGFYIQSTASATTENYAIADEEAIEPRGLAASLTVGLEGGNGQVSAIAKNSFTLFPSTIQVYVELYSSETYQESYTTMTLEKTDYISDLNMGKSLIVSAPTQGEQRYWQARMRYKFDNREWVSKTTSTLLYDGQGNLIK